MHKARCMDAEGKAGGLGHGRCVPRGGLAVLRCQGGRYPRSSAVFNRREGMRFVFSVQERLYGRVLLVDNNYASPSQHH